MDTEEASLRRSQRTIKPKETSLPDLQKEKKPSKPKPWTRTEKSQLLGALEIYDEKDIAAISDFIPTKTPKQIEYYIRSIKRRAMMLSNRVPQINELNRWAKYLEKGTKDEDMSYFDSISIPLLFISVYENLPHPNSCDGIDFKAAYEFLFCAMTGIPPNSLNKKTTMFISKTFKELETMVSENSDLREYIKKKWVENVSKNTNENNNLLNPLNFPIINIPLGENK